MRLIGHSVLGNQPVHRRTRTTSTLAVYGVSAALLLIAPMAQAVTLDCDNWTSATTWGTHTNADGWVVHDGTIKSASRWQAPVSAPYAVWLQTTAASTNTWLQSPYLPAGIVSTTFRVCTYSTGENSYALQFSADGNAWTTLASYTQPRDAGAWAAITNTSGIAQAGYLRFLKTAGSAGLCHLGFDDVVITEPTPGERQFGPCSRRTPLAISEIMYHAPDGTAFDFVEILNTDPVALSIEGYRLSGDVAYTFPPGTTIDPHAFLLIAADPASLAAKAHIQAATIHGPFTGALSNGGGTVRLRNREDAVLLEVDHNDSWPWPTQADGAGHSLVLACPDFGENDLRAWAPSAAIGGSPGHAEMVFPDARSNVRINEALAHTDLPQTDFIELYNGGDTPADLTGCIVTDEAGTNRYTITNGLLAAGSHMAFDQATLGFSLSMHGTDIYLVDSGNNRCLDAVRLPAQVNGVSTGRYPDGADELRVLSAPTMGGANAQPAARNIVINEIMFHPMDGDDNGEYVELHNRGAATVDIGNWRFVDGIGFTFPPGTAIAPGGYVVVARDRNVLLARHPHLGTTNLFGNFSGSLSDSGERIVLAKPDDPDLPDQDFVTMDSVTYSDGWGRWADGGGSSLELLDPHSDNRRGSNWDGSDESAKSEWTTIDLTDYVSDGDTTEYDILFVLHMQDGEFLIDDISMQPEGGGAELVPNPSFTSGISPWTMQGNHVYSGRDTSGGYGDDGGVLHVRASGQGNVRSMATARKTQFDRVEIKLASPPVENDRYRMSAKVRWLAGWPYMRLSLGWYWMEAMCRMQIPENLGTPGLPNSHGTTNTAPAVTALRHDPLLPASDDSITVTCRVTDPNGIAAPILEYRDTANSTYQQLAMMDDATGGDRVAGDGIFAATIPPQAADTMLGFRVHVADNAQPPATRRHPSADSAHDCLVRIGADAPTGTLQDYHVWVSPENMDLWLSWPFRANEMVDMTLVYDGWRPIYNSRIRWRGNGRAFDSLDPRKVSYSIAMPKTDRFLGDHEIKIDQPSRNSSDGSHQQELHGYWMAREAGIASAQVRYMHVHVNGSSILRQDLEVASRQFCGYWYDDPDPHAFEHKAEEPFIEHFKTPYPTDVWNMAKYAHGLQKKRTTKPDVDYQRFMLISEALALTDDAKALARLKALVHPFGMAAYFAGNRVAGNKDTYGWTNRHNGFVYASRSRRLRMHLVDLDGAFKVYDNTLFPIGQPALIYDRPYFRRAYLRVLKAFADRPLNAAFANPTLDAWHAVLNADGFSATAPNAIKSFKAARLANIQTLLNNVDVPFAVTSAGGNDFETGSRIATLQGTAPITVQSFRVNGVRQEVDYPSVTAWSAQIGLDVGANPLTIEGYDRAGNLIHSNTVTVTSTAPAVSPAEQVIITEIMCNPGDPDAEYVEIHNRSTTDAFDLRGWRLNGADITFRGGTILQPGDYRVVAADLQVYTHTYTNAEAVAGDWNGNLDNGGETLTLRMPLGTNQWVDIDKVTYDTDTPWPGYDRAAGMSLQLIDLAEDNNRPGNWGVAPPGTAPATPGAPNSIADALPIFPDLWISEVMPSNVSFRADNAGEFDPWIELFNAGTNALDLGNGYTLSDDCTNVVKWAFPAGTSLPGGTHLLVWADAEPGQSTRGFLHADFRIASTGGCVVLARALPGATQVVDVIRYGNIAADSSYGRYPDDDPYGEQVFHQPTPGAPNSTTSQVVMVRINEYMAWNGSTLADPADGDFDDWFELYNAGHDPVNLGGFSLTDDLADIDRSLIPGGVVLAPGGHLLVWADGEPDQNGTGSGLHVDFKLSREGDTLALFAPDRTLVDVVSFSTQSLDISTGCWPDGALNAYPMTPSTPAGSNRVLLITDVSMPSATNLLIGWTAQSGTVYRLESRRGPGTNTWQAVGTVTGHQDSALMQTPAAQTGTYRFYRLRIIE